MTTTDAVDNIGIGKRPGLAAWALLSPLLLWLLILVILPTAIMVVFSFCQRDPAGLGSIVYSFTTENYARIADRHQAMSLLWSIGAGAAIAAVLAVILRTMKMRAGGWVTIAFLVVFWTVLNVLSLGESDDASAAHWLKITVLSINYAGASTLICVLLGYPVAYFIGKSPEKWRNLLLMLVMVPFWTSFLIRTYAWVTILRNVQNGCAKRHFIGAATRLRRGWASANPIPATVLYSLDGRRADRTGVRVPAVHDPTDLHGSVERLDNFARSRRRWTLGASGRCGHSMASVVWPLTSPGDWRPALLLVFVPAVGMYAVSTTCWAAAIRKC